MPEPVMPVRREPIAHDGPFLAGMEEVGTGILDHVDAMQRVAASAPLGPLLINAGPGTGKTYVLIRRVAYLIKELHMPASQCLILVANAAAVNQVKHGLTPLVGDSINDMTILDASTVNSRTIPSLGHVFVDDLHMLNNTVYDALRSGRGGQPAFTATADPDSRIDDNPTPVDSFPHDFPDARIVRLTRNHRGTAPIIAAATQLITPVTRVSGRMMLPARSAAGTAPIGRYFASSRKDERRLLSELRGKLESVGIPNNEIGVIGDDGLSVSDVNGQAFRVVYCPGVTPVNYPDTPQARRRLFVAMTRAADLLYVSHQGAGSPILNSIDSGLFSPFGQITVRGPRAEQPRLL